MQQFLARLNLQPIICKEFCYHCKLNAADKISVTSNLPGGVGVSNMSVGSFGCVTHGGQSASQHVSPDERMFH